MQKAGESKNIEIIIRFAIELICCINKALVKGFPDF